MASSFNPLPRLQIKRKLSDIIANTWNYKLVDSFKTGVKTDIQVWITNISESYDAVGLNSKNLNARCTIDVVAFSEINETGVQEVILKLLNLTPADFDGVEVKVIQVLPLNSDTSYINDSSEGHVMADVSFEVSYFYKRG